MLWRAHGGAQREGAEEVAAAVEGRCCMPAAGCRELEQEEEAEYRYAGDTHGNQRSPDGDVRS